MKIFGLLVLIFLVGCGKHQSGKSQTKGLEVPREAEYMGLINLYRANLNLPLLTSGPLIIEVAASHAKLMALGERRFGHMAFKDRCAFLRRTLKASECGEIVAMGQETPSEVFDSWLDSRFHRETIEHHLWTHTGISQVVGKNGRTYWTQIFLSIR